MGVAPGLAHPATVLGRGPKHRQTHTRRHAPMFLKRTTALAAAAATALTFGAAPVQAGDHDDLAAVLFGVLATGLLAHAISESNDGGSSSSSSSASRNVTVNKHYHNGHVNRPHHTPNRNVTISRPHGKTAVPGNCQRRLKTQNGTRTFVGQPCLQGAGYSTARLPRACQRNLDFGNRNVKAWGVGCLQRNGYKLR